jgi:putative transcriptional regulator
MMDGVTMKNKVRTLRETRGLTQKQLGEAVGVSRQAVNAVETGKYDPSVRLAYRLSRYFALSIDELFQFEEDSQ